MAWHDWNETQWDWIDPETGVKWRRMRKGTWTTKPKAGPSRLAARMYTWPAFALGLPASAAGVADYTIQPQAGGIVAWLMEEAGRPGSPIDYLLEPQFQVAIERWANAEARRMRLEQALFEKGEFDAFGRPSPVLDALAQWDKRCGYYGERLGLDPKALANIHRNLQELHRERDADKTIVDLQQKYKRRFEVLEDGEEDRAFSPNQGETDEY